MPLLLLALLLPPPPSGLATIHGSRLRSMLREPPPELAPRRPHARRREVELTLGAERIDVHARFWIDPGDVTWFAERILGPEAAVQEVLWDGRPAHAHAVRGGYLVLERTDGPATLELHASLPRRAGPLDLLPATIGRATLRGEGLVLGGGAVPTEDGWALDAGPIVLAVPPAPEPPGPLVDARIGVGLTVEDGEVLGRGRIELVPRRGELSAFAFTWADLGDDLVVEGPDAATIDVQPGRVEVAFAGPLRRTVELTLRWTVALGEAESLTVPLPSIRPLAVHRVQRSLQIARSGEREVAPRVVGRAISSRSTPPWGQGLVSAPPTAAFLDPEGALALLRFQPDQGPPALVDVAEYTAATTAEGRILVKARYAVRSDRAAALQLRPPPGVTLLSVRVDGRAAPPATSEDGRWRVPLPRSVESVGGLLSFPVELAWLQGGRTWDGGARRLALPALDAPVAVQRATVYLPPGYSSRRARRGEGRVEAFSQGDGIRYGFALDAEGEEQKEEADALFGSAIDAWKGNRFGEAQGYLDAMDARGASNDDVDLLQQNLDVVTGARDRGDVSARRILEQARARSKKKRRAFEERKRAVVAGRRDTAKAREEVRALGGELALLEPEESQELRPAAPDPFLPPNVPASLPAAAPTDSTWLSPLPAAAPTDSTWLSPLPAAAPTATTGAVPPEGSGLDKFDYGDPEIDWWPGRGEVQGMGGLGMVGSGYGSGGAGYGELRRGLGRSALTVTATNRGVLIPRIGAPILFERLLLPAGLSPTLILRARRAPGAT